MALDSKEADIASHANLENEGRCEVTDNLVNAPECAPLWVTVGTPGITVPNMVVAIVSLEHEICSETREGRVGSLFCSEENVVADFVKEAAGGVNIANYSFSVVVARIDGLCDGLICDLLSAVC
jgi:hypothetical protein